MLLLATEEGEAARVMRIFDWGRGRSIGFVDEDSNEEILFWRDLNFVNRHHRFFPCVRIEHSSERVRRDLQASCRGFAWSEIERLSQFETSREVQLVWCSFAQKLFE